MSKLNISQNHGLINLFLTKLIYDVAILTYAYLQVNYMSHNVMIILTWYLIIVDLKLVFYDVLRSHNFTFT